MNKLLSIIALVLIFNLSSTAEKKDDNKHVAIKNWLQTEAAPVLLPAFHNSLDIENKSFQIKDLLIENYINLEILKPEENETLNWNQLQLKWNKADLSKKGYLNTKGSDKHLSYYATYIEVEDWSKAKLIVKTYPMLEIYLDGKKIASHYNQEDNVAKELSANIALDPGKHCLIIKALSLNKNNSFKVQLKAEDGWKTGDFKISTSDEQFITINKILDGKKVNSSVLSANGEYALISYSRSLPPSDKSEKWKIIQSIINGKIIHTFRGSSLSQIKWLPQGNKLSYSKDYNGEASLFILDLDKGQEREIATHISNLESYTWTPDCRNIIYSQAKDHSKEWKIRKIQGMEDRLPGFRYRSFLYKLNVESGVKQKLTHGTLSTQLNDISSDSEHIIFTQSRPDYKEYPYSKQNLYQMNLRTFEIDTIWEDKLFGGSAQYSPDNSKIVIQAGPSCFGKLGENIGKQKLANNYDGQLYIMDLKTKKVNPISFNFDPAIGSTVWNKNDGHIYFKANDKDYVRLFKYDLSNQVFTKLNIKSDVVKSFNIASNGSKIAYIACSISSPYQAYIYDLNKNESTSLVNPEKEKFNRVKFGKTEDWNFTKKDGKTIIGRVYYPPNFDANKKYPMIVNYYAGTVPVERSFGGRYPLNLYAAMGYVVYLLQPSGATGFGQEFSAEHQNNWGITTADEIIEGTKKFAASHSFVDANKIGCIGASYGGFMTMLLQTRTDIFAAAISHAGISDITSYWGEGYWGYSYSVNASGKSFPWSHRKLYVDQSPLFNADKVTTPMLLIHGSVDTNVPLGESIQMYQALKLLGKEVDFIQVKDQNHQVLNYTQRILWNNTIFAYFAKHLKDKKQWWESLYPDQNI
ncbi:S9 family peptidase [Ancylomarina euxinus]|uniref:S9 family peptidase n=1 Tax=Ancylomarina euxinus TaxID=2283627 RepID=A0A425Y6K7_9BACT|nr:S9 family peptidase [Ancylomarina euxinus]MCZ4694160.1 S9 family peptidase [Ancylomarina euxinus]MUP15826.1 prolyl oligopeptidase family serine peptidase [Ancylomarina euxinus]RRG23970.1 S9 family peptidase [Ancylomarina euxinus]